MEPELNHFDTIIHNRLIVQACTEASRRTADDPDYYNPEYGVVGQFRAAYEGAAIVAGYTWPHSYAIIDQFGDRASTLYVNSDIGWHMVAVVTG